MALPRGRGRGLIALAGAGLLLVLLVSACAKRETKGSFNEGAAKIAIASLIQLQLDAYKKNDPRAFYATYSPTAQKACSFADFSTQFTTVQQQLAGQALDVTDPSFSFRDPETTVDVVFTVSIGGSPSSSSGVFALVNGKWFEDDQPC